MQRVPPSSSTDDEKPREPREAGPKYGPYDRDHLPSIGFEEWAQISAAQLRRDEEGQLEQLESREVELELWNACNAFWVRELANQASRGKLRLAARYGAICQEELARRPRQTTPPRAGEDARDGLDGTVMLLELPQEATLPFEAAVPAVRIDPPAKQAADASSRQRGAAQPASADAEGASGEQTAVLDAVQAPDAGDPLPFHPNKGGSGS